MIQKHIWQAIVSGAAAIATAALFTSCDPHKWEGGTDALYKGHGDHEGGEDHDEHPKGDAHAKDKHESEGESEGESEAKPRAVFNENQ